MMSHWNDPGDFSVTFKFFDQFLYFRLCLGCFMLDSFAGWRSGKGFRVSGWGFQAQKGLVHFNGKLLV